jgi:excisionase family DNA binding protein
MNDRAQYSIEEARRRLGISRNSIYALFRSGKLPSVIIGCRRFVSQQAIEDLISKSTTTQSPTECPARLQKVDQNPLPLPLPPVPRRRRQS